MKKLQYEKLTIYEVDTLKNDLIQVMQKQTDNLVLDIGSVKKIDMPAIQLLVSLQKTCIERGFKLVLTGIQDNVKENLKLCACHNFLGVES